MPAPASSTGLFGERKLCVFQSLEYGAEEILFADSVEEATPLHRDQRLRMNAGKEQPGSLASEPVRNLLEGVQSGGIHSEYVTHA